MLGGIPMHWNLMTTNDLICLVLFSVAAICVTISLIGMTIRLIRDGIRIRRR
jgi:hypothetical protein